LLSPQKIAAVSGLATGILITLTVVILPSLVAPPKDTGVFDATSIFSSYNHPILAGNYWAQGLPLIPFILYLAGIYVVFREAAKAAGVTIFLLAAVAIAAVEVPLLVTGTAIQWTLVDLAAKHAAATDAASRTALEVSGVVLNRVFDLLGLYWIEGGFALLFGIVFLRTKLFGRWVAGLSLIVGIGQLINTLAIPLGLPFFPFQAPSNILFIAWFFAVSFSLLRLRPLKADQS
jgi:hypothetical protein